jgi:hypothetical protein
MRIDRAPPVCPWAWREDCERLRKEERQGVKGGFRLSKGM